MRRALLLLLGLATAVVGLRAPPAARAAAVVTVDTFQDTFDGSCADADCSLRDAIAAVDTGGTVRVRPGYYPLTLAGAGGVEAGDLDVERAMTVVGIGESGAFLDASGLGDRAVDVAADVGLRHLTLLGGSPVGAGGVIRVRQGELVLSLATVGSGRAQRGGGIAVLGDAAAQIFRSWGFDNHATEKGGFVFTNASARLERSTLSANEAKAGGGASIGLAGSLLVLDSTLSNNVAMRGGGAIHSRGEVALYGATVARNRARVGGAIMATPDATIGAVSSVLSGNSASERGPTCSRRLSSDGHNVADTGGCGLLASADLVGVDPLLGPLVQNGGSTPTHALRPGSPAVGRGAGCGPFDQRGAPRRDCDSGAYELVFCRDLAVTIVGTPGRDDLSGGIGRDVFLGLGADDVFQGSLDADRACGGHGDDVLIGGPGKDGLAGNAGDDTLRGEAGNDQLIGGTGVDVCRGGDGRDTTRRCERVS
jgi:CSLREA domain-containing protein